MSPSPSELDRISATRVLSDAELIQGGASYSAGVLKPTAEQVETIARRGGIRTTRSLGSLALLSDADSELERGQEAVTAAAINRLNLTKRLEQVIEPYLTLFADKVPSAQTNERSIFDKLKTRERHVPVWTAQNHIGGVEVNYRFKLKYRPGEDYNDLSEAVIELRDELNEDKPASNPDRYGNGIDLKLAYTHGRLTDINMSGATQDDVMPYGRKRPFTEATIMEQAKTIAELPTYSFGHLYLGDNPALKFYEDSQVVTTSGYEFDADANLFRYKDDRGAGRPENGKAEVLSVDEFVDIAEGYLSLIPTREFA